MKKAIVRSQAENINYRIVFNCRLNFPFHSEGLKNPVISMMNEYPGFHAATQADVREWKDMFSGKSKIN